MEKIVVVVEDVEVARSALVWALHNILRSGDILTLLHVYTSASTSRTKKKLRNLRLKGFQLQLQLPITNPFPSFSFSFSLYCFYYYYLNYWQTKTEIVVTEGDEDGGRIAAVVSEIGASTLVLGLHDRSFLYRLVMPKNNITRNLKCRVLAIKEPTTLTSRTISLQDCSTNMDFSQIEIATLSVPEVPPQKISYQICPDPTAIIWRTSRPSRTHVRS